MVEAAASMENDVMMAEFNANNGSSLTKLINEQGVQLKKFSDDIYDSFGEAAEEVFAETVEHSDLAKRIHDSFIAARTDIGGWQKIADQEYLRQRNRVIGI
jgi:TRAP-type mannitol/chloroaromatic compound transport system substrate-binding protein